ncbi:MAG TPA: hypothetical protein VFE82_11240 [Ramlibacter sp.]|jgi:hypothetical protein|uniref:hypothetical protein n=1 Tax=Ramlibacter sp. TaxID=1917967 RepID=UPI002D2A93DB|nr:hypothetical protein [Ramlibacter sp.]HZY19048.1 hypothetical protein [Ramlibacter sp.]
MSSHTALLKSILRFHGRDPQGYDVQLQEDGTVSVRGPGAAAFYPQPAWTTKFIRHLLRGFYDPVTSPAGQGAGVTER